MTVLVKVNQLTKSFGPFKAVENISFNLKRGEVLGFLGPNGAGKTTTMRMITGFIPASTGEVYVCDNDISKFPILAKEKIGYVPEGAPLYSDMTATSLLNFVAETRGFAGNSKVEVVKTAIEKLQLESVVMQN